MVLRSKTNKGKAKENLSSNFNVSNKSKTIKKGKKKAIEAKNTDSERNDKWNINSILTNIFIYTELEDLINFNTVCKRWNHLTNPIIHKSVKLQRRKVIQNKVHDKRLNKSAKTDAEVGMCISDNAKYASLIRQFRYTEKIEPQRAIELFKTFKFIIDLTLEGVNMSQDQFIAMLTPLAQIKELNLICLRIRKIVKNRFITKAVELPSTLTNLTIDHVYLVRNCDLFVQTINSHKNLKEFSFSAYNRGEFLEPFQKNYPSLTSFEYCHEQLQDHHPLAKIFEHNPQLIKLKLGFKFWNNELMSNISRHLIHLKNFNFSELKDYHQDRSTLFLKFFQPTKINKLNLYWDKLSTCSLESILKNCPELEELSLNQYCGYMTSDTLITLNISKPTKIKRLEVICNRLSESSLSSILINSPQLKELDIQMPEAWKEWMRLIGANCMNLEHLIICPSSQLYGEKMAIFYKELYEIEFLTCNHLFKSTLTHLTLNIFNFYDSRPEYFDSFKKLKFINYPTQAKDSPSGGNQESNFDKGLWSNYKLITKDQKDHTDIKLIKLNTQSK